MATLIELPDPSMVLAATPKRNRIMHFLTPYPCTGSQGIPGGYTGFSYLTTPLLRKAFSNIKLPRYCIMDTLSLIDLPRTA